MHEIRNAKPVESSKAAEEIEGGMKTIRDYPSALSAFKGIVGSAEQDDTITISVDDLERLILEIIVDVTKK